MVRLGKNLQILVIIMSKIKLKICGVQNRQEAEMLVTAEIDYIGLNFVPSSKRCIEIDSAKSILDIIRSSDSMPVLKIRSLKQFTQARALNNKSKILKVIITCWTELFRDKVTLLMTTRPLRPMNLQINYF